MEKMTKKVDNQTGLNILSSILEEMSYPNQILSKSDYDSMGVDVKGLHKLDAERMLQ